jgi:hypothetical protein
MIRASFCFRYKQLTERVDDESSGERDNDFVRENFNMQHISSEKMVKALIFGISERLMLLLGFFLEKGRLFAIVDG